MQNSILITYSIFLNLTSCSFYLSKGFVSTFIHSKAWQSALCNSQIFGTVPMHSRCGFNTVNLCLQIDICFFPEIIELYSILSGGTSDYPLALQSLEIVYVLEHADASDCFSLLQVWSSFHSYQSYLRHLATSLLRLYINLPYSPVQSRNINIFKGHSSLHISCHTNSQKSKHL